MAVKSILKVRRQGGRSDELVLALLHCMWKKISLRGFVAHIHATIREDGSTIFLLDAFGSFLLVVVDGGSADVSNDGLELASLVRKPWPKCSTRKFADDAEWRSQRLSQELFMR